MSAPLEMKSTPAALISLILDTRKTTPNMRIFEKYAVKTGGGCNHRYNLSDGIQNSIHTPSSRILNVRSKTGSPHIIPSCLQISSASPVTFPRITRLYAVGETCCNGVHGANRLASNSLLESLLFAKRAAEDIAANYESAKTFEYVNPFFRAPFHYAREVRTDFVYRYGAHIQPYVWRAVLLHLRVNGFCNLDIIENGECSGAVVWDKASGEVRKIFSDYTVLATGRLRRTYHTLHGVGVIFAVSRAHSIAEIAFVIAFVLLATGGIGGVFKKSTNFRILTGDGVAICLNRGIAVDNINYVQIHPTFVIAFVFKAAYPALCKITVAFFGFVLTDNQNPLILRQMQGAVKTRHPRARDYYVVCGELFFAHVGGGKGIAVHRKVRKVAEINAVAVKYGLSEPHRNAVPDGGFPVFENNFVFAVFYNVLRVDGETDWNVLNARTATKTNF